MPTCVTNHVEGEGWYWRLYHYLEPHYKDCPSEKGGPYETEDEAWRHGDYEARMYYDCIDPD